MDTQLPLSEDGLRGKADELAATMERLSEVLREASALVSLVRDSTDPRYADILFATRANVSAGDVRILAELAPLLAESGETFKSVSPYTVKALADAREDVRDEALELLRRGRILDSERLDQIRGHLDRTAFGDRRAMHDEREAALESFASRRVPNMLDAVASLADDVVYYLEEFIRQYVPRPDGDGRMVTEDKFYTKDYRNIIRRSSILLTEVERVLGNAETFAEMDDKDWKVRALRQSYRAVRRLEAGRFGHDGGFALESGPHSIYSIYSTELLDALRFLANAPEGIDEIRGPVVSPPRKLRAVELCAGAGGQAIGLKAAGFDHLALFEMNEKRVTTLRKNMPNWKVMHRDLRDVPTEELRQYRGVDLLAGGPPCKPFSQANPGNDRRSKDNLFGEMIRAVRAIRPRAFMFENVVGLEASKHAAYLAGICTDLAHSTPGYRVELLRLNAKHYGLPQSRQRLVIVGIRSDEPGELTEPRIGRISGSVADVLGPAIILHETPDNLKDSIAENSDQWLYDRWAETWKEAHKKTMLPTITATRTEKRSGRLEKWAEKGFDISSISDTAPAVGEVRSVDFKPRLTVQALARAQGFPPGWTYHAAITGQISMIGDAFPPVMAKAVGLRIYAALTGTEFDYNAALAQPVIDEERIGKLAEPGMLTRRLYRGKNAKIFRVMRGESIESVEPDPTARTALASLVDERVANQIWEQTYGMPRDEYLRGHE